MPKRNTRASFAQPDPRHTAQSNGTTGLNTSTANPALCKVYYFHTDQVGMPEELTNADGQLVWQASYTTWGATVAEELHIKTLANQQPIEQGDKPEGEQNLRFQGQYLDRSTGLHYNTFRYYDADIGRFICPDPIGLQGGINLHAYAPNPLSWIDPWGGVRTNAASGKKHADLVTQKAQSKYGPQNVQTEVYIRPLDNNGNPVNYRVRADNTVGSAKSPDFIIESKGSPNAPLTKNQKKGYPLIDRNGGIIKQGSGKDKISTPISSTPHKIIRPRDIDKI